jgi:hypothetical protein
LALSFVVREEEYLVLLHRTAHRSAEAVLEPWRQAARIGQADRTGRDTVGIAGVVGIAGAEVIRAAVVVVGSGAGLCGDDRGDSLAEFGVEVLGGDLGFGHRIHCGVNDDDSEDGILVVSAVEFEGGPAECLAVDLNLLGTLRVFVGSVGPAKKLGAGKQELKVGEVLVAYGQAGNLLLVKDG